MSTGITYTLTQLIVTLPEPVQNQVVEHMRDYIANLQDEIQWNNLYKEAAPQLIAAARKARKETLAGKGKGKISQNE